MTAEKSNRIHDGFDSDSSLSSVQSSHTATDHSLTLDVPAQNSHPNSSFTQLSAFHGQQLAAVSASSAGFVPESEVLGTPGAGSSSAPRPIRRQKSRIITLYTDGSRPLAGRRSTSSSTLGYGGFDEDNDQLEDNDQDEGDDDFEFEKTPTAPAKRGRKPGIGRVSAVSNVGSSSHAIPFPTAEVELEKILFYRAGVVPAQTDSATPETTQEKSQSQEEFYIKFKNRSYLHCEWVDREWIETNDKRGKLRIRHFLEKTMADLPYGLLSEERPFNESYVKIDRIIHSSKYSDPFTGLTEDWYLVKWCSLPYDQCTWEAKSVLINECDDAEYLISLYESRSALPHERDASYYESFLPPGVRRNPREWKQYQESPAFKDGNQLRAYQLEGLNWLLYCWHHHQSSLIADEMGLGKTVQSIAFLNELFKIGVKGPFLIIAPLSTIPHWERTVTGWTDMNCVVFHGSAVSRGVIQKYEFFYLDPTGKRIAVSPPPGKGKYASQFKFDILITTYEMAMSSAAVLRGVGLWRAVIVDEAHRLKNRASKVGEILKTYSFEHRLLLTGTPIQNSLEELWSILNFLDSAKFPDNSEKHFLSEYDLRSASDVQRLQELLHPIMLRRLKEDVEKSIPIKEETIIEVELTDIQRAYYRAILERNFPFLRQGTKRNNLPNLINAMMELRKCCIHPYLLRGAEEKITEDAKATTPQQQFDCMIQASGKLVLLSKLLPKLRAGGHRVLIFSQMTKCLDLLGDYLRGCGYLYERIDGNVRGESRQAAIDRFSAPDSQIFCFLLCTRAGGVGINLTAADTCIIFDSDWNPQNDLQAQARCHRIGQKKNVSIYRLITRNSYERTMFDKAGMKLGLDKAVLSKMEDSGGDLGGTGAPSSLSKTEIEELLRKGAYAAVMSEESDAVNESKKFCEEDIDSILQRRTQVIRQNEADQNRLRTEGSLFSKATFSLESNTADTLDVNDPDFWEKWAQKANVDTGPSEETPEASLIISSDVKRRRRRIERDPESDAEIESVKTGTPLDVDSGEAESALQYRHARAKASKEVLHSPWSLAEKIRIERGLMAYGFGAWEKKLEQFPKRSIEDIKAVEMRLIKWCLAKLKKERDLYELRGGEYVRKVPLKDSSRDTPVDAGSDEDDVPTTSKDRKTRVRDDNRPQKDDHRLYADIEYVLSTPRWEIPNVEQAIRMTHTNCHDSFGLKEYKIEVDAELGPFPFPGATKAQLLEYCSFIDDAPKEYFDHLEKKPRNLLLRIQSLHFLRTAFDIDPHAVSEVWVSGNDYNGALKKLSAEMSLNEIATSSQWVDKYQNLFANRLSKFSFPSSYASTFLTANPDTAASSANSIWPGWQLEEDRDILMGMIKNGYQNYEKIRSDPVLVFSAKQWHGSGMQPVADQSGTIVSVPWPGGGDLGARIRRLIAYLVKNTKDTRPRLHLTPSPSKNIPINDLCWARKDRSEFMKALNCLGIPLMERKTISAAEAKNPDWEVVDANLPGEMILAQKRNWTDFKELAFLEEKSDYSIEMFCRLFVRRAEEMVRKQSPKGLTPDMMVSGRALENSPDLPDAFDTFPAPTITLIDSNGSAVDPCEGMALERARRLLRRIVFMRTLRTGVFLDPHVDLKLSFAKKSAGLPDWWIAGDHDKAFLIGICKHGMTPLRQNRLMFDPELPFHVIVKEKLEQAGLGEQLPTLIQKATMTKHELNQIKKTDGFTTGNTDDIGGDNEDEQAVSSSDLNIEDIVGWPKDLIRSRRVEILMDLLTSPSSNVASMIQYFGKDAVEGGNKRKIDDETGDFLSGALELSRSVNKRTKLDLESHSNEPLTEEDNSIIQQALNLLQQSAQLIDKNRNKSMVTLLKQYLPSSELMQTIANSTSNMDVDADKSQ